MVTCILNIGLSSYEGSKYEEALESMLVTLRKGKALEWVAKLGHDFYVEDRSHPVLDRGHEPTLVVVLYNTKITMAEFKPKVHTLCEDIGQHCIAAVLWSDWVAVQQRMGYLIGPGAYLFDPFDFMKFINPIRSIK